MQNTEVLTKSQARPVKLSDQEQQGVAHLGDMESGSKVMPLLLLQP